MGAAWALVVTGKPRLGAEMFRRLALKDDFKLGLRRASWYARRGWPSLDLSRDPVFVFCRDLDAPELEEIRQFILRRKAGLAPGLLAADLAYISAINATSKAGKPGFAAALDCFTADADRLLAAIAEHPHTGFGAAPEGSTREFSADLAQAALNDIADLLHRNGFTWFVLSGTFLGLVREGGFLAHDYDIDLGVMAGDTDVDRLHRTLAESSLFRVSEIESQTSFERDVLGRVTVKEHPVFFTAAHVSGVKVDMFVHHHDNGTVWHGSSLFRWDNSAFDLAPYSLAGVSVLGPTDANRYLTENYGAWRIPVVEFNSATDTPNQRVVLSPLSAAIFLRRTWLVARSNPREAEELLNALRHAGLLRSAPQYPGGLRFNPELFASR